MTVGHRGFVRHCTRAGINVGKQDLFSSVIRGRGLWQVMNVWICEALLGERLGMNVGSRRLVRL